MVKTRTLSLLLILALLASLFAASAFAEDAAEIAVESEAVEALVAEEELELAYDGDAPEADEAEVMDWIAAQYAEAGDEAAFSGYVLMNVPYTVFYQDIVKASNASAIDAITSATGKKAAYFWDSSAKGNVEVAYGEGATIKGVRLPVALSEADYKNLPSGLTAADAYYTSALTAEPKLYANATVSEDGKVSFSGLSGQPQALAGAKVSLEDTTKHGDYMLKISDDGGVLSGADKATFAVYGAVLKTADKEYPLYHLENLYYKDFHEIAFCTTSETTPKGLKVHKDFFADLEGATITELVYYTNAGIYTISTSVKVEVNEAGFTGYVLMNVPYEKFYGAVSASVGEIDAITSATNKVGNYGKAGGAYHTEKSASVAEDGTVTAVGGDNGAKLKGITWAVKADSLKAVKALGGKEITDASSVTVATLGRGATSSSIVNSYQALMEAPAYSYYLLDSEPANYLTLSGGSFSAGKTDATAQETIDVPVSYGTNWGDVQLNLSAASAASGKLINAVVLTAEDGATAGLVHLANIWSASDMAWRVATVSGLDGKKITNVRYYCSVQDGDLTDGSVPAYANYVYDYPVDISITQVYSGTVTAKFAGANAVEITGLPADIQNPQAKVYYTTGGRNATYTYLTPLTVDPADDDIDPVFVKVENGKIAIEAGSVTNAKGETASYGAPVDGTTYTIELRSDNYVLGKITAEYVAAPEPTVITLTKKTTKKVKLGTEYQLQVKGKTIKTCKTSATKIAAVSKTGLVTLKKAGTAKITVTTTDKKKIVLTLKVVDPAAPTKVTITGAKKTLKVGDTLQLGATVAPATANQAVKWSSSKKSVAAVDAATGLVTAKKAGTAKITVTTSNGKKATVTIKVKAK